MYLEFSVVNGAKEITAFDEIPDNLLQRGHFGRTEIVGLLQEESQGVGRSL